MLAKFSNLLSFIQARPTPGSRWSRFSDLGKPRSRDDSFGYPEFEKLLGPTAWRRLPATVRQRFDGDHANFNERIYAGKMTIVRASKLGKLLAQCCQIIGTPVVPLTGTNVFMFVRLFNVPHLQGIAWERIY